MDFTGIIAEYDPFHNGHAAQIAAVRAAGAQCIAVCMSSGAVQRGGVPILPERVRVQAALAAGADIVIALPAPYACATAEQFAAAGVYLLAALGCDTLAFGAETPDAPAQGLCCVPPTTFWASNTARQFWRSTRPSRLLRCRGWARPTAAGQGSMRAHRWPAPVFCAACPNLIGNPLCLPGRRNSTAKPPPRAFCWTAQNLRRPF